MQELGISSIPNLLLTHYRQLGLNETELILLLKIKMHLEKALIFRRRLNFNQACPSLLKNVQAA